MTAIKVDPVASAACIADRDATVEIRNKLADEMNVFVATKKGQCREHGVFGQYVPAVASLQRTLLGWAVRLHAAYPQYNGHWNGWMLGVSKRRIGTKGGVVAESGGDLLLVKPIPEIMDGMMGPFIGLSIWSLRSGHLALVKADHIALL